MDEAERLGARCAELEVALVALGKGEAQYRRLLEIAPIAIGIHHAGVIAFANRALVSLLRAGGAEELLGRSMFDFLPPEHRAPIAERARAAVATGENPSPLEVRFLACDGAPLDVSVLPAPVVFDGRQAMMVMVRDLTELRRAEAERRELAEQMTHVQKLESLGVLAGGIAHDFNNLLMGLTGNLELAALDLPATSSAAREHLEAAVRASQKAIALSQQMLAYSGRGIFFVEPLDLNRICEEMVPMLGIALPKRARLRLDLAPGLPAVEADASQIGQVVMNLVMNAAESLDREGEGSVTLATRVERCDREALSRTWIDDGLKGGTYAALDVTDTGSGMDAGTLARAFDPFFTTKFEGRGLGLPAVLGIVRGHRGALELHSEPGRGTRVRILLPAHPRSPEVSP